MDEQAHLSEMEEWAFPNSATPEGSAAYYCIRFSAEKDRDRLALLFAWKRLLADIGKKASDPGVARLKLDWWRQELNRIDANQCQHPIALALAKAVFVETRESIRHLQTLIDIAEQEILQPASRLEESIAYQEATGTAFAQALVSAIDQPDAGQRKMAGQLGAYIETIQFLSCLHQHPESRFSDKPKGLIEAVRSYCETETPEIRDSYREAKNQGRSVMRPVLGWVNQTLALEGAMAARGYSVLEQQIDISPIRRLWSAWWL